MIYIYRRMSEFELNDFIQQIDAVLGSETDFNMDDEVELWINTIDDKPIGARLNPHKMRSAVAYLEWIRMVWDPRTTKVKPICFIACIAAYLVSKMDPNFQRSLWYRLGVGRQMKKPHACTRKFIEIMHRIYTETGLKKSVPIARADMPLIQQYLNRHYNLQLMVYDRKLNGTQIFAGIPKRHFTKQIAIGIWEEHAYWIRNPRIFFRKRYQCDDCGKLYNMKGSHWCLKVCQKCTCKQCPSISSWLHRENFNVETRLEWPSGQHKLCKKCNMRFDHQTCYENHLKHNVMSEQDMLKMFCIFKIIYILGMRHLGTMWSML